MTPYPFEKGTKLAAGGLMLIALALLYASTARAQSLRPVHMLVGGGPAFPKGSEARGFDRGYQLQAALETGTGLLPLTLRVEGFYNRFGFTLIDVYPCPPPGCTPAPRHPREATFAGTLNGILQPPARGLALVPYALAGVGLYRHDDNAFSYLSGTDPGLNAGAGLRVPALHAFIETRMHVVRHAPNYLPVTAGIRF